MKKRDSFKLFHNIVFNLRDISVQINQSANNLVNEEIYLKLTPPLYYTLRLKIKHKLDNTEDEE